MSCNGGPECTCGCCAGISVETPQGENNLPGLSSISYRTGTWASFKESMLARLSSSDYPALAGLKTRDNDDFTIAFLDATAVMLDILTFYQERLANESYLRTATQLSSLTQLSRLIGYEPSLGVSASTYLAFTLRAATGLPPDPTAAAITIPAGTQVQSVPAQGQKPQSFQISADILAKPDWNALPIQTGRPWVPKTGDTSVYLAGTATQLNPGDAILIVGNERLLDSNTSSAWDFVHVTSVRPDTTNQRTLITWAEPLSGHGSGPAQKDPKIYALRQRASLFGFNAIFPLMLAKKTLNALQTAKLISAPTSPALPEWDFGTDNTTGTDLAGNSIVDFDAVYSKLVAGSWMVSVRPGIDSSKNPVTVVQLYNLTSVTTVSRSDYGVSAKITRAITDTPDGLSDDYGATRGTSLLCQSELLPVAEQPFDHPLYGTFVDLEVLRPDLAGISAVAVTGKSQKIAVNLANPDTLSLSFAPDDDPTNPVTLAQGQVLTLLQPPSLFNTDGSIPDWIASSTTTFTLAVADAKGRTGTVSSPVSNFKLVLAATSDPVVQESALVAQIVPIFDPFPHTRILLKNPLINCYDRTTTTVNANVAAATAGAPVTELLGSGSAATPNQQFTLKQSPLTYTSAPTPTGSLSSLVVRANGAEWTAVPTLYSQPPTAQVYATRNLPGGIAQLQFGDGVEGATLPTGQNNILASYRIGIGTAGNVAAGAITTLVDRPVGVSGVTNPMPSTGGQDPQSIEDIRANAPLSVLTLGRAVSIDDYQNFAASFAGIAKASAFWIPNGVDRGVFLTVAAAGGVALDPNSQTITNLVTALQSYGNPHVAIYVQSFLETTFGFTAALKYDPAYVVADVQAAVLQLLQNTYSFANRDFGQGVSADELAALIQSVAGVVAVNVTSLFVVASSPAGDIGSAGFSITAYNTWIAQAISPPLSRPQVPGQLRICPFVPQASLTALPYPAEILVLDPNPINVVLGVMS
jgi:Baseplate J-like protein